MPFIHKRKFGGRYFGLWTGTHGSGKTVGIGSMPGPILLFDFDGKVDPILNFYPKRTDIEYFTVGLSDDSRNDVIGFMQFCDRFEKLQDHCPYATVCLDSYTMYSTVSVLYQMGARDNKDLRRTKGGLPIPDWDEYKGETGVAVQIMETAKIIPAHFIMTAHPVQKATTQKQGGSTNEVLASMIKGSSLATYGWKTVSLLPSYFSEMYYFYTEPSSQLGQTEKRFIQTVSCGEIVAKSALGLPAKIDITGLPFWPVLQSLIKERGEKIDEIRRQMAEAKIVSIEGEAV